MKKYLFAGATIVWSLGATAQSGNSIHISGTRFTYPLFQQWAKAFTQTHPGITITVDSKTPADSVDIKIASYRLKPTDVKENETSLAVSRYVELPIVNSQLPNLKALQQKGFTEKDIQQVFFFKADANSNVLFAAAPVVYKRDKAACSSVAFANHYGSEHKDIVGTGVKGDDRDLENAVKNDVNGITYNSLGIIYDVKTRKLVDSIAVIPYDLNENGKVDANENIYATLDKVVNFVEKKHHPKIPLEDVNVIVKKNTANKDVAIFLQWVLENGQQYNHQYGFINLDKTVIQAEKQKIAPPTFTTYNLYQLALQQQLVAVKRTYEPIHTDGYYAIHISEDSTEGGLVWLPIQQFKNGTIEFDVKGKDVFQQSFVGIAFHGQNDSTYEGVYFRPFNFFAADSVRRIHAVQCIFHPKYRWKNLRSNYNAVYEKAIIDAPNPNEWFHVRVVVQNKTIQAFVNNHVAPALSVVGINNQLNGKVGLLVNSGGGYFANVSITPL